MGFQLQNMLDVHLLLYYALNKKGVTMKILPVNTIQTANARKMGNVQKENMQKSASLPKSINAEQNLTNPTFKNCGATQAGALAGCSIFGIT